MPASPKRRRLSASLTHYVSKLDEVQGPLRTTSDGNIIGESTGDYVILSTPPHSVQDREIAIEKNQRAAKDPQITLPEAKNGATGLDDSRTRKPLVRWLKNKLSGSDRLPKDEQDNASRVKEKVLREVEKSMMKEGIKVEMNVIEDIRKVHGDLVASEFGGDWYEHCLVDQEFWLKVLGMVSHINEA